MNWYKKAQLDNIDNIDNIEEDNIENNDVIEDDFIDNQEEVFYHGTSVEFDVFESKDVPHKKAMYGEGFYFTDSEKMAQQYATRSYIAGRGKSPHIKEVSLNMINPLRMKHSDVYKTVGREMDLTSYAKEKGYDGLIITDLIEEGYNMGNENVVFDPFQIKTVNIKQYREQ